MNLLPALLSVIWLAAAPGKPPSAEETRLFDEGMRAFQAGNPRDAERAWRAGFALDRDPAFLVRMGEAEEKAGLLVEAADSYRRYLHAAPDAADRAEIEQRLARLGPAGEPAAVAPGAGAGAAEPTGAFGAGELTGGTTPPAGAAAGAGLPAGVPAPARDDELARRADGDDETTGWTPLNITAWVATGATVVLLGAAGYYAASAGSAKDDVNLLLRYQDPITGAPLEYHTVAARYQGRTSDGRRDDRLAKGALLVAAGTAVIATVFFILDAGARDEHHAQQERARPTHGPFLGLGIEPEPGRGGRPSAFSSLQWTF